jgi:hypothetical protein
MMRWALCSLLAVSALGCHRKAKAPAHVAYQLPERTHVENWPGLGEIVVDDKPEPGANKPGAGGGVGAGSDLSDDGEDGGGKRFHPATVFVDGSPRAACTYNELPSRLKVERYRWDEEEFAHRVRLSEYLTALGIDLARVKAVHFYGGRDHVSIVTGTVLRKHLKDLYFGFSRDLFGKPTMLVRNGAYRIPDLLDIVTDIAVYVDRDPPLWDVREGVLVDDQGNEYDGIPYLTEKMPRRAVRVNVDSRLVTHIKRNLLEGNVEPINKGEKGDSRYRLNDVLAFNNIPTSKLRAIDLVTREERVIHLTRGEVEGGVQFVAPHHAGGEVIAFFGTHQARISVINVYIHEDAPAREMRTLTLGPQARTSERALPVHGRKTSAISRGGSP